MFSSSTASPRKSRTASEIDAPFSSDRLIRNLRLLQDDEFIAPFPSEPMLKVCKEVAKLTGLLGTALKFAASDVTSKIDILETWIDNLEGTFVSLDQQKANAAAAAAAVQAAESGSEVPEPAHEQVSNLGENSLGYSFRDMIMKEVEEKTAPNVKNPSIARTLLRLLWFLDFTEALTSNLADPAMKSEELRQCATKAYEERLSKHHTWLVRKAVGAGLYACPGRTTFCTSVGNGSLEGVDERIQEIGMLLRKPVAVLWEFYRSNGLDTLP